MKYMCRTWKTECDDIQKINGVERTETMVEVE